VAHNFALIPPWNGPTSGRGACDQGIEDIIMACQKEHFATF